MSLMMMLAMGGKPPYVPTTHTKTFTSNGSFPVPAGVTSLDLSGRGAAGTPAHDTYIQQYQRTTTVYQYYASSGTTNQSVIDQQTFYGTPPANYCDDQFLQPNGDITQTCYSYQDTSYMRHYNATTGASASGFGKVFPGGTGGTAPTTSFTNVTVTGGASYSITVPSGGSITITYKA